MKKLEITKRTKVNQLPKRAFYETEVIFKILDEAFVCQIAFDLEGHVNIIPTLYGRKNNMIFIHGSKKSRMLKSFLSGKDICVSVTIVDGLVLARSAFHHSINYRSVIIFGKPEEIIDKKEKTNALETIMERIIHGRWNEIRKPNEKELNMTSVFSLRIDEASAKVRSGPPADDKDDLNLNIWAGVIPFKIITSSPVKDSSLNDGIILPTYIKNLMRE